MAALPSRKEAAAIGRRLIFLMMMMFEDWEGPLMSNRSREWNKVFGQ
jgi:hypothetical protein